MLEAPDVWATSTTCGTFVRLRALVPGEPGTDLLGLLRYRSADPFAVELACYPAGQPPVVWRFARETLEAGLRGRAGAGSVLVCTRVGTAGEHVFILLHGPESHCVLRGPVPEFRAFLAHSRRLVPYGEEHRHLGLDRLIARLAAGADRRGR